MSDMYDSARDGYKRESAALVFIYGSSRPLSGQSMPQAGDIDAVATKVVNATDHALFADVMWGNIDIVSLIGTNSQDDRIDALTSIRSLRNSVQHSHNFVSDAVTLPIISMYGRAPTHASWRARRAYSGWMFAKTPNIDSPADELAAILLQPTHGHQYISFLATLTGTYDVAIFIEADTPEEFNKFVVQDMPLRSTLTAPNTLIVSKSHKK